jgi:UDP-glucose 4-epimerase
MILEKTGSADTLVKYTGGRGGWPGDVPKVRLSTRRLQELGWKAKHTSDQAVAKTINSLLDAEYSHSTR